MSRNRVRGGDGDRELPGLLLLAGRVTLITPASSTPRPVRPR
ncbi:MAG TPA: hypothetical protein VNT24_06885 [Propionibacteriaceae bacterium]|nr:hypothetical protein [Propionibacteriaceae bacterium]